MLAGLHRAALALLLAGYSCACLTWSSPTSEVPVAVDVVISTAESIANKGITSTLDAYEAEGLAVVAALPVTGDVVGDYAAKNAALAVLDTRWAPVWEAWRKLREANDAVLAARAAATAPDLATLEKAYCALRVALPASARASLPALGSCS